MTVDVTKYKMLDQIDHILLRPEMYMGSSLPETSRQWFIDDNNVVQWEEQTFIPGFDKMFDEIIVNSVDHSKRPEGKHITRISVAVNVMAGTISIFDNGGIPVVEHPEYKLLIPDMIFGNLLSGSNYNDEEVRSGAGTNGIGSKLTNIFSTFFRVETSDGKNSADLVYRDNMKTKVPPVIQPYKVGYTRITYCPDYERLGMTGITDTVLKRIKRRCYEIAACNPHLTVSFNGADLPVRKFEDFVSLFSKDNVCQDSPRWSFGLAYSETGFTQVSFVNSVSTHKGGTHIDYVMDKVVDSIRDYITKKTKQNIRPSDIRSQFQLFINCNIDNPRFDSQTKEFLLSKPADYGSKFELAERTVKNILRSDVMVRILQWAESRRASEDTKAAQAEFDKAKAASHAHIEKYHPATIKDRSKCVLFLAEGDSALKPLKAAKKPHQGVFPLRGKPDNVFDQSIKVLMKQKEFQSVLQIMGLKLTGKVELKDLLYQSMVVSTDADLDGFHIRGLLVVAFHRFWPELIEQGVLKFLKTPIIVATVGRTKHEFFTAEEYAAWETTAPKHDKKYHKGLGGWSTEDMSRFMNDPQYMLTVKPLRPQDIEKLSLAFHPDRSDDRKEWLALHI